MADHAVAAPAAEGVPPPRLATFSSLQYRDYRFLWLGQVGHAGSLWMEQIVRPVLILQLTGSALMLGLVVATRMLPMLLFGLLVGALAAGLGPQHGLLVMATICLTLTALTAVAAPALRRL